MFVNGKHLAKLIEQQFPKHLAESWDNVGFQVGSPNGRVEKVMTALELTPEVLEEAIDKNVDLIIVHHPLIFKPLKSITDENEIGQMVRSLIQHKIGLYAAHTNLDAGKNGTGEFLANLLDLKNLRPLDISYRMAYVKLVTYVPKSHAEAVASAIGHAGGGSLGNYEHCHFFTEGIGTFVPLEGAKPYIGVVNEVERVEEVRVETIVEKPLLKAVLTELIKAHPYELPAYDLIPLENEMETFGIGVVGTLSEGTTFEALVELVKDKLEVELVKGVKALDHTIRQVAVCPGAGADFLQKAASAGCDVLITGDLKYHEAQLAKSLRLSVIDAGHYETEQPYMAYFGEWLRNACEQKDYEVKIINSEVDANPLRFF